MFFLVSEMATYISKCWLCHLFHRSAKIKNKNCQSPHWGIVLFSSCLPLFLSIWCCSTTSLALHVRNPQKARSNWHWQAMANVMYFPPSDGQSTKAKVVSNCLKTDSVTWNGYFENVKDTCHCYCGHALKQSRKQPLIICWWQGHLRGEMNCPRVLLFDVVVVSNFAIRIRF